MNDRIVSFEGILVSTIATRSARSNQYYQRNLTSRELRAISTNKFSYVTTILIIKQMKLYVSIW